MLNTQPNNIIHLSDGRILGFSRMGDPSAVPVLMFHGIPGSRLFTFPTNSPLDDGQLQVVLPERPGYGLSDVKPGRTILDWVDDITQLVDNLSLNEFHIIGISGGGPYALACARQLPKRILSVCLVASVAPLYISELRQGMGRSNKMAYYTARLIPLAIRLNYLFNRYMLFHKPVVYLEKLYTQFAAWDKRLLQEPDIQRSFLEHMREAYRPGVEGAVRDIQLLMKYWGFDLEDINTPLRVWQGEQDPLVPPAMGHYLAEQLPNCQTSFIPDVGHCLFLDDQYMKSILTSILDI